MTAEGVGAYLARRQYLVLATAREDGRPHATSSSFVVHDGHFWIPTEAGTLRLKNLRAHPYASIVVAEGDGAEHRVVLAEGPVAIIEVADTPAAAIEEYAAKFGRQPGWARVWLRMSPAKLFSYDAAGSDR
jgi:nitroimidazol reductase NimA-like FMN-containing flavoprotein (pyridoxamine 5'-phosphate oxidase superfamily)